MHRTIHGIATRSLVAVFAVLAVSCSDDDGDETEIPNPASEYCVEQGGEVEIVDEEGGQVGYCNLPDGRRIEEWEFFEAETSSTEP